MKTTRADEAEDMAAYKQLYKDSMASMKALEATEDLLESLKPNCDWIARTFDTRMEQRKAEMEGLANAKAVLAGAAPEAGFVTTKVMGGQRTAEEALRELDVTENNIGASFLQRRA